jgi:hypothetical protein
MRRKRYHNLPMKLGRTADNDKRSCPYMGSRTL